MIVWLYIGIILLMRVVQHTFDKYNANKVPSNSIGYLKYTVFYEGLAGVFALGLFAVQMIRSPGVSHVGATLLYASLSGVALAVSCCCSLYTLSQGTMALNAMFGTAGLLVPTVASIFLYDEILNVWQWLCIGVFMVAAWLLIGGSKKTYGKFTLKTFFVLLLSLAMNGLTMLMQTMFGRSVEGGNVALFSVFSFGAGVVVLGVLLAVALLVFKARQSRAAEGALSVAAEKADTAVAADAQSEREAAADSTPAADAQPAPLAAPAFVLLPQKKEQTKLLPKVYLFALFLAVAVFLINQFATLSTPLINPAILFAFINGGSTVISVIVGAVLYKEKLNARTIVGIVLGVSSLVLLKVFAL